MKPIVTITDLNDAYLQERALIFIYVGWAIHARNAEKEVRRLLATLEKDFLKWQATSYRVDITDGEGEVFDALVEWIRADPIDRENLLAGGCGALLWLRSGSICASLVGACNHTQEQLIAISHGVFDAEK